MIFRDYWNFSHSQYFSTKNYCFGKLTINISQFSCFIVFKKFGQFPCQDEKFQGWLLFLNLQFKTLLLRFYLHLWAEETKAHYTLHFLFFRFSHFGIIIIVYLGCKRMQKHENTKRKNQAEQLKNKSNTERQNVKTWKHV